MRRQGACRREPVDANLGALSVVTRVRLSEDGREVLGIGEEPDAVDVVGSHEVVPGARKSVHSLSS